MNLRHFSLIITHNAKNAIISPCFSSRLMLYLHAVITMNKKIVSVFLLLLTTIIWGSAFVSQNIAMEHMQPIAFQAVRCIVAIFGMIPVIMIADRFKKDGKNFFTRWMDKKLWKAGLLCGIPLFFACNLQQFGLVDTDAGKAGFLTAMYIIIVPIIGIFRKQKQGLNLLISIILATAGLYCLSCAEGFRIKSGDLLLLGCALMFSFQITAVDVYGGSVDAFRLNALQSLVCAILSSVIMFATNSAPSFADMSGCIWPILHTGVLSMGIAYGLQIIGQRNLSPTVATLLMSLESVFAALFGALFLHEKMAGIEAFGCGLMFIGVLIAQIPQKEKVHP